MDESELRGPSLLRAFAPVWVAVVLLLLSAFVLPVALALALDLADFKLQVD